ncbi:MAG: hypothetical protein LBU27_08460 [Candidatus Peribacteria bacterium]|jgi:hypothetical protein|nr:hypothetical protein [Candidatus Peribacteria bacterium]
MQKYSIMSILGVLFLVGCSSLPQLAENPAEQPQIFSGVFRNTSLDAVRTHYSGTWTIRTQEFADTGYEYSLNIDNFLEMSFYTEKRIQGADITS